MEDEEKKPDETSETEAESEAVETKTVDLTARINELEAMLEKARRRARKISREQKISIRCMCVCRRISIITKSARTSR